MLSVFESQIGISWVIGGVAGNTSLLACWHWFNIGPTLKYHQLKYCCWSYNCVPTVVFEYWGQWWPNNPCLNIKVISIIQKLYNLILYIIFDNKSVILLYKNNFNTNLVILSDFVYLTLSKILKIFIKLLWLFYENYWLHIECFFLFSSETVVCHQLFGSFERAFIELFWNAVPSYCICYCICSRNAS